MNILRKITVFYLGFLSVLLPLKFATLAMMPEASCYFPAELWEYIIVTLPSPALGIAGGAGLLLSIAAFGREFWRKNISHNWSLWAWLAAFLLAFIGFFNASMSDYPVMATAHIAGFLAYMSGIYLYLQSDEHSKSKLLTWWASGLLLVLASGLYQYFIGFDEQLAFYYSESGAAANIDNIDMSSKMAERRIFATFSGCNVLAGYLLLTGAIGFYIMYKWSGKFAPADKSRILFCGILTAALLFVLLNTGSRGALAAIGGTVIYTLFWLKIKTKYKISGALLIVLGIAGLIMLSVCFGRTFGSFTERIGYWRTSALMMAENWYAGSGWGDFFIDNMRFRVIDLEETARGPHNLFLIFGCSCGVFAMLAVMAAVIIGLLNASISFLREKNMENSVIMFSIAMFSLHSMLDVNFQIGASMAIFCTLTVIGADGFKSFAMNKICKAAMFLIMIFISIYGIYNSKKLIDAEKSYDFFKTQIHTSLSKRTVTPADVLAAYDDVESKRPGSAFHPVDLYNYFSMLGMNQNALPYLELAIKRSPERAGYYYYRAMFMARQGRKLEALHDIHKARKLYPHSQKYREFEENLKNSLKYQ